MAARFSNGAVLSLRAASEKHNAGYLFWRAFWHAAEPRNCDKTGREENGDGEADYRTPIITHVVLHFPFGCVLA